MFSFLRGVFYGLGCGVALAVGLLALLFFTVGLNDSNGIINAYTLFLCAIFGFVGSVIGGIIGLIKALVTTSRPKYSPIVDNREDDAPIPKP